ncbi:hypothetical protein SH16_00178 [Aeromonas caviae]|nr:hypothetical protein SH16_00178 [Aeromonas caviae]BBR11922.1 hypothetical protein WP3S18E02_35830 [Aeromonas caviae]
MSHANHAPFVNRSKLEAEIHCGSVAKGHNRQEVSD